jgi:heme o synthase
VSTTPTAAPATGTVRDRAQPAPGTAAPTRGALVRRTVLDYVALTKPRIIELLLVTTIPVMFLAEGGFPSWWLVAATVIGGYLAAGGANVINMWYDRDIDAIMKRTKNRPLVTGRIAPRAALTFGIVLSVVSVLWLGLLVNATSGILAAVAILAYAIGYTMVLKRRTSQNIVWGGIAGAFPVLIGWSAVTGTLSWTAVLLAGVIFFWTPPHYWPLADKFTKDYADAGVPMLPVVAPRRKVAREMVLYTLATVACSVAIIPLGHTGVVYGAVAILSGAWFLYLVLRYTRRTRQGLSGKKLDPMAVFHGSITYVSVLFLGLAIDPFVTL